MSEDRRFTVLPLTHKSVSGLKVRVKTVKVQSQRTVPRV